MAEKETDLKIMAERFSGGDERAMEAVFKLFYFRLYYYAKGIVQHSAEAEDIAMTALGKLWRRRKSYATPALIEGFLRLTVRNACINYLEHQQVKARKQDAVLRAAMPSDNYLENRYIQAELAQLIYREMENLPDRCREVVKHYFIHERSHAEIARLMNIEEKTVRNQKARAIELLRTALLRKSLLTLSGLAALLPALFKHL